MAVSYKMIWKHLIDKDMKRKDLCAKAGINLAFAAKMGRNGHITTEILLKNLCGTGLPGKNIMEIMPDNQN